MTLNLVRSTITGATGRKLHRQNNGSISVTRRTNGGEPGPKGTA
jgi:hypothetical protein